MKLFAISDLHLNYSVNREALEKLPPHPNDWLILAGDIAETEEHLRFAFELTTQKFAQVLWVPGNHELWVRTPKEWTGSVAKYEFLVALCQDYGILTPEDAYPTWDDHGFKYLLVPLFLLYDYSFRPESILEEKAVSWAKESGILCRDEIFLNPTPYPSKQAWCRERLQYTQQRLSHIPQGKPLILINHFPLREELIRLKKIPRFSIWCGTKKTQQWHKEYSAHVVVSGHLHMRATDYQDSVRFEEVSLGYPKQWNRDLPLKRYLREILPGPAAIPPQNAPPLWRKNG